MPANVAGPESRASDTGSPLDEVTASANAGDRVETALGGVYEIDWGRSAVKWAMTDLFALIRMDRDGVDAVTSPVHPVNPLPAPGTAVAVACAFGG